MKLCKRPLCIGLTLACLVLACADDELPDTDQQPAMETGEPASPTTEPGSELRPRIELAETAHTLTLTAVGEDDVELGAMVLERVDPLEHAENPNGDPDPRWFPIYVHGYFDVAELTEAEVAERAQHVADEIAYHPAAGLVGCAVRIAMAAALCMDGPAVVLTCPVGLHGVMCACGAEVGIKKADLAKFCD